MCQHRLQYVPNRICAGVLCIHLFSRDTMEQAAELAYILTDSSFPQVWTAHLLPENVFIHYILVIF